MGQFSFKSSGQTKEKQAIEALTKTAAPIGIITPLRLGSQEGIYGMNYNLPDQVHDNLRNLLQTNWGEHLGIYDFGANLRPITTEFVSQEDFDAEAIKRISAAVSKWMPFISLEDFISEVDRTQNKNTGVFKITVSYTIPALQTGKRALLVTLYVI